MNFVPVRCPKCHKVAFALLYGLGQGVCCKHRITASVTRGGMLRILQVDRPARRFEPDDSLGHSLSADAGSAERAGSKPCLRVEIS